jgi:hypothetical protein
MEMIFKGKAALHNMFLKLRAAQTNPWCFWQRCPAYIFNSLYSYSYKRVVKGSLAFIKVIKRSGLCGVHTC